MCSPTDAVLGTWNEAVKPPAEFEVIVAGCVATELLSQVKVIVLLGENVVPVTGTVVPAGPLGEESAKSVSL